MNMLKYNNYIKEGIEDTNKNPEVKLIIFENFLNMIKARNSVLKDNKIAREFLKPIETDSKINFVSSADDENNVSYLPLDKIRDIVRDLVEPEVGDTVILKDKEQKKLPDYAFEFLNSQNKFTIKRIKTNEKGRFVIDIGFLSPKDDETFWFSYIRFAVIGRKIPPVTNDVITKLTEKEIKKITESPLRQKMAVAKFAVAIFGDKFTANEYEEFNNLYKNEYLNIFKNFELVRGKDIPYWYDYNKYALKGRMDSSLAGSCMGGAGSNTFQLYADNPNKINLLILRDTEDPKKIAGRAIVWHLDDPKGKILMDTIYVNEQRLVDLYVKYAEKNGWIHKYRQRHSYDEVVIDGKNKKIAMVVQLYPNRYNRLPYLDTLSSYNPRTGLISNRRDKVGRF